jgi:hypothetical protein
MVFAKTSKNGTSQAATRCPNLLGTARSGQAAVLGIFTFAITMLVFMAQGVSNLQRQTVTGAMYRMNNESLYSVSLQGIQEALATRMVPRSNQLNFVKYNERGHWYNPTQATHCTNMVGPMPPTLSRFNVASCTANKPLFPASGFVRTRLEDPNSPLLGVYQYVIAGGDPARRRNNAAYLGPEWSLNNVSFAYSATAESSPFYVVSRSLTCVDTDSNKLVPGALTLSHPNSLNYEAFQKLKTYLHTPTCQNITDPLTGAVTHTRLDRRVTVMQVGLDRSGTPFVYGSNAFLPDDAQGMGFYTTDRFKLPNGGGAFVPNYGWVTTQWVDFSFMWGGGSTLPSGHPMTGDSVGKVLTKAHPASITRVLFYDAGIKDLDPGNAVLHDMTINQNDIANSLPVERSVPGNLPPFTMIKLFFQGGIDFRSLPNYNPQLCGMRPSTCNIVVRYWGADDALGTPDDVFLKASMIPLLPSSTQVIVSAGYVPNGIHSLEIRNNLRDFAGRTLRAESTMYAQPTDLVYRIRFRID